MSNGRQLIMKQHASRQLRSATVRRGFTLLEFVVALVVLGVAMAGMFPLLAVLSRNIQPIRKKVSSNPDTYTYVCPTPARDWQSDAKRSTWYVLPFDEPWARKLGASARLTTDFTKFTAYEPTSIEPSMVLRNDDNDSSDSDGDGAQDYTGDADANWIYDPAATNAFGGNHHRKMAWPAGTASTGGATWSISVSTTGWYSIQATWPAAGDQITDARYRVILNSNQASPLAVIIVDQTAAPYGVADAFGRAWTPLTSGPIQLMQGDLVQVLLDDVRAGASEANKYVVADGVRLVHNEVTLTSLTRVPNDDTETVTADVSVVVQVPK
jgi:prepilin-type N-terminal cleavage/methylation domain-containing protein